MATQARLAGTLPSPKQAMSNLRLARIEVRERAAALLDLKTELRKAKAEGAAAAAALEQDEGILVDAADGSPEAAAAESEHRRDMKRAERAERDRAKVAEAVKLAAAEHKQALGHLRAARDDLEAIREGRRRG